MHNFLKAIVAGILFLLPVAMKGQEAVLAAFEQIARAYNTPGTIGFTSQMKMYNRKTPALVIERMSCSYVLQGKRFVCNMGPLSMLSNDTYYVSVDRSLKILVVGRTPDLSSTTQLPVINLYRFADLVKQGRIGGILSRQGNRSLLTLNDSSATTGCHLYRIGFNPTTGYIHEIFMEMMDDTDPQRQVMMLELTYTKPAALRESADRFSEKYFFSISGRQLKVADRFKGYEIINQL